MENTRPLKMVHGEGIEYINAKRTRKKRELTVKFRPTVKAERVEESRK